MLNISDILSPWRGLPYMRCSFATPIAFVDGVDKAVRFTTIDAQNGKLGELRDPATFGPGYTVALKRGGVYLVQAQLVIEPTNPLDSSVLSLAIAGGGTGQGTAMPCIGDAANASINGIIPLNATPFNVAGYGGVSVVFTGIGDGGNITSGKLLIVQIAPGLD